MSASELWHDWGWIIPLAAAILAIFITGATRTSTKGKHHADREAKESLDCDPDTSPDPSLALEVTGTGSVFHATTSTGSFSFLNPPPPMRRAQLLSPVEAMSAPEAHDGPFTGWRMYHVQMDEHFRVRLVGTFDTGWETAELDAACTRTKEYFMQGGIGDHTTVAAHLQKGDGCTCGIYLMKGIVGHSVLFESMQTSHVCVAQCSAWGTVLECEDGYRAEHVRIDRIFINDTNELLMAMLREKYNVPVLSIQEHATPLLKGRL